LLHNYLALLSNSLSSIVPIFSGSPTSSSEIFLAIEGKVSLLIFVLFFFFLFGMIFVFIRIFFGIYSLYIYWFWGADLFARAAFTIVLSGIG
jgi:hypothetical protein